MIKKFYLKLLMSLLLVAFMAPPVQAETFTVYENETSTGTYIPIYGTGYYLQKNQMIYPATDIEEVAGNKITGMKFYLQSTATHSCKVSLRLGETSSQTSYSSATHIEGLEEVATNVTPSIDGTVLTIPFNDGSSYTYSGDNLVVEIEVTTKGSYSSSRFLGKNTGVNSGFCYYNSSGSYWYSYFSTMLPRATFTYEVAEAVPYAAKVTPKAENGLAFGSLAVGDSKTMNVILKNTGTNAFTPSISVTGTDFSTDFIASELTNGQTATIPVVFNPTSSGDYNGTLTINCGEAGIFTFDLTGNAEFKVTVAEPEGSTTSSHVPVYGNWYDRNQHNQIIYPAELLTGLVGKDIKGVTFYPLTTVGFYGGSVSIRLTTNDIQSSFSSANYITGLPETALGTIVPVSSDEILNIPFDDNNGFLYTGGNLIVDIMTTTYTSGNGYYSDKAFKGISQTGASLYAYSSTSGTSGASFSPTIENILPMITFTYEDSDAPATPRITANPTSVSGLTAEVDGASVTATVTVIGTNLTGDIAAAIVEADSPFSISPATIAQADGSANGTITVTYAASIVGEQTGTLRLTSDGATTVDVPLSATGTAPVVPSITTSVSELAMNAVVGTPATSTFTVNGANLEGDITIAASGEGFSVAPTTIAAADAANGVTVTVTYNPVAAGNHNGAITLTSANAETVGVTLTGTAVAPVISGTVTPASLSFECQEGATATGTITVANTGNQPFTPSFSGIEAPFSIEAATEIAAGESKEYTVTYAPTAVGTHTGTLTVTINGTATEVALNGTAEEAPEGGELTVADQGSSSTVTSIAPIYGGQYTSKGYVQMLYPASLITDLVGKQITKVTFYEKSGVSYCSGGVFEVHFGETSADYLASNVDESTLDKKATVTGIATAYNSTTKEFTITLSEPYVYNGGNLVIETKVTTAGSSSNRTEFYGQQFTNDMVATSYSVSGTQNYYKKTILPKATFTYEKAKGVALVSPEDGVLNFGEVSVKGHKDKYITLKNNGSAAVTPTFGELAYPYSVGDVPASIAAGEEVTIAVTMTPSEDTQDTEYNNVPLTVTFSDGSSMTITINGKSHVNQPTMTTDDFAQIEYTWVDGEGNTQTSNLAEIATEPAQMVELMRKVYMTKEIPGNWYRGYTSAGETSREVAYPAIGSIVYGSNGYDYNDAYGWNIGFGDNVTEHILDNTKKNYKYFNPDEYKPNEDGITLLLVEMNDNEVDANGDLVSEVVTGVANKPTSYESLCSMFGKIFKSVRVVTESRRMGAGEESGTIFKLNADKLNRFFLLAKGRLRMFSLDVDNQTGSYIDASSTGNSYRETEEVGPFFQMFEQLSPVDLSTMAEVVDVYQDLVNMQSYGIHHDCQSIPFISSNNATGHEFNLYGKESQSEDCQDVRDLMITIPARRMQWWYQAAGSDDSRDGVNTEKDMNDMYKNYNKQYVPKMGLFVIKQYEITGEKQENADVYDLNLSWTSNLLEFLPTGYGIYNLYRVVTNADGTKTYVKVVDNLDPNTFSYVDHIEMQQTGQVVTYVVQGQDKEKFLSLQLSNEESFVIPGLDRAEQIRIALNSDYYFSRYDAATKTNNYSNSLIANNTVGTNVKPSYLENGSEFKFWRATLKTVDGEQVVDKDNAVNFANCVVSGYDASQGGTLTYVEGDDQTNFSNEAYGAGYHANEGTSTISIVNGEVVFDGLKLYDNFRVSVEENTHPAQYVYYVTLQTAEYFNLNDEGTETSNQATSNTVSVPVYKTGMTMNPLTAEDVEADVDHQIPASTNFDVMARYSSKSEILGYYIYRWADSETDADERSIYESNGADASPQGQAGNQATHYTVAMNSDYTGQTEDFTMDENGSHPDVTASFEDNFMVKQATKADTYTYAPVVELFAPQQAVQLPSGADRVDYNTYGGPQQMTAGGIIKVSVVKQATTGEDGYQWTDENGTYVYYNAFLNVLTTKMVPDGYKVAKIRAWRKIDSSYLGEEAGKGYEKRLDLNDNGEYLFSEIAEVEGNYIGGEQDDNGIFAATFGAKKLSGTETIPMEFVVRVYFTKDTRGEGDYYIAETVVTDQLSSDVPTVIYGVESYKEVASIKYYNMAGIESDVPFQGANIEVVTYKDGSRTSRKLMK